MEIRGEGLEDAHGLGGTVRGHGDDNGARANIHASGVGMDAGHILRHGGVWGVG